MMTRLLYSSIIIATEGRTDTPTKRGSEKAICEAKYDGGRDRAVEQGGKRKQSRLPGAWDWNKWANCVLMEGRRE